MRSVLTGCFLSALVTALVLAGSSSAAAPRVTVIADSAFTAVTGNEQPLALLTAGFDFDIDVGICRRLTGASCPDDGGHQPPTLVDVVNTLGSGIAPTAIVEVGYNEFVDSFPQSAELAMTTLVDAGVKKILWLTMSELRPQYIAMNQQLAAVAARHPEVGLVDWGAASRGHDSWFQGDGVHLGYDGAVAMARLLRGALVSAIAPPLVAMPTRLPIAHVGKPYSAQLVVQGGLAPLLWRVISGRITDGLHVLSDGRIVGTPRRSGKLALSVRIVDAVGQAASLEATVAVARR